MYAVVQTLGPACATVCSGKAIFCRQEMDGEPVRVRSISELNHQERLEGVVVQYRPRAKGRLSLNQAVLPLRPVSLPDSQDVHIRLAVRDLRCGAWISTREGHVERLWVIAAITTGSGDGCVELTLTPKLL